MTHLSYTAGCNDSVVTGEQNQTICSTKHNQLSFIQFVPDFTFFFLVPVFRRRRMKTWSVHFSDLHRGYLKWRSLQETSASCVGHCEPHWVSRNQKGDSLEAAYDWLIQTRDDHEWTHFLCSASTFLSRTVCCHRQIKWNTTTSYFKHQALWKQLLWGLQSVAKTQTIHWWVWRYAWYSKFKTSSYVS